MALRKMFGLGFHGVGFLCEGCVGDVVSSLGRSDEGGGCAIEVTRFSLK